MTHLSVSIDFILDKKNRLHSLAGLINDDSFTAVVSSLAPGSASVAKTIGGIAQKVMTTLMPAEEREPILQFSGDFDIATGDLKIGYYVILGTRDPNHPLPAALTDFTVQNGELLSAGGVVTAWSYVIFEIQSTPARTRDLNENAAWDTRLREAEDEAEFVSAKPDATAEDRRVAWKKCEALLRDAEALLRADQNYLRSETRKILDASIAKCARVYGESVHRGLAPRAEAWEPDIAATRAALGMDPDSDMDESLDAYAEEVAATRTMLAEP